MVLSKIHDKAREFTTYVPTIRRALRESRRFAREVDIVAYRFAWVGAIYGGLSALGVYALLGTFFQTFDVSDYKEWRPSDIGWPIIVAVVGIVMILYIGHGLIWMVQNYRERLWKEKINLKLDKEAVDHLASLDAGRLADPEFIKLKGLAMRRYRSAAPELFNAQCSLLGSIAGLVVSIGMILVLDPLFITLAILPVAVMAFRDVKLDKKRRAMWEANHFIDRKKDEYENCLTELPRLMQGKLFRFVPYWRTRYTDYQKELWSSEQYIHLWMLKWNFVIAVLEALSLGVLVAYLGAKIVRDEIALSQLFFLWGSMRTFAGSLRNFSSVGVEIRKGCLDYDYRERFLTTKPLLDESHAEVFRFTATPRLELANVSFRYPRQDTLVLSGCSLSIAPGEKVALVGENGSGKTTILRLLSKIYLPDEGSVMIDGLPTSRIAQACWFEQMLYCTQDTEMPDLVVEEAIIGGPPGSADMSRLQVAADHARATSVIEELPGGYKTQLGADWSGGWEPSAGQSQRLKITSAFYRLLEPQVRIGLFDEPMSQCDVETRDLFYRKLRDFHGKTVVVVAHDPVYLHYFDRVILVEEGKIVQDMRTSAEIAAYQREATPQFEEEERQGNLRVVE